MTVYSRAEFATRALRYLGLVALEETPTAAEQANAEEMVEAELGLLAAKGIPVWNGSDVSIPHEYLGALLRRVCLPIAVSYGLQDIASATLAIPATERDLRVLGAVPPTGTVQQVDYF